MPSRVTTNHILMSLLSLIGPEPFTYTRMVRSKYKCVLMMRWTLRQSPIDERLQRKSQRAYPVMYDVALHIQ